MINIADSNSDTVAEYTYDALGRRIEKKDIVDSSKTTRYYYNNGWQVLTETDTSGVMQRWYPGAPGFRFAQRAMSGLW